MPFRSFVPKPPKIKAIQFDNTPDCIAALKEELPGFGLMVDMSGGPLLLIRWRTMTECTVPLGHWLIITDNGTLKVRDPESFAAAYEEAHGAEG